jgi:hypothetical protein
MKVTNNRPTNAWFHYKASGMPKRVFVGAYKSIVLGDLADINQVESNQTISNFSQVVVPSNSILTASTTNTVIIQANIQAVSTLGNFSTITVDEQTDRKWEIEW